MSVIFEIVIIGAIVYGIGKAVMTVRGHAGARHIAGSSTPISIKGAWLLIGSKEYPLAGAQAEVIAGGKKRTTATRVVTGTLVAPVVGTAIGAMAKKGQLVVVVTGPSWSETVVFKDVGKATLAARMINDGAARLASAPTSPPISPARPASVSVDGIRHRRFPDETDSEFARRIGKATRQRRKLGA